MYKKLFLVSVLFCSFFIWNNVFAEDELDESQNKLDESQNITSEKFTINTDIFSVWWEQLKNSGDGTSKWLINSVLWEIIKKLMIVLWIISLFIMTIWAWYMILFHGQDEYLSKWKNIFIAWITSLVIALSSYYLVNLVWYILYK